MGAFLRWTRSFTSRIDAVASQIENHDALVSAAVRDAKDARARARVQLKRVREDGRRMRQRWSELKEAAQLWKERAVRLQGQDEARAVECMRRMKRAERERRELDAQIDEHTRVERQLTQDIRGIDARIQDLVQQRNLLRTRQSRAEALSAAQHEDGRRLSEVDDILERWEIKVARVESDGHCDIDELDDLDSDLGVGEEFDALKAELDDLVAHRDHAAEPTARADGREPSTPEPGASGPETS